MIHQYVFTRLLPLIAIFPLLPPALAAQDAAYQRLLFRDASAIVRDLKAFDKAGIASTHVHDIGTYQAPFEGEFPKKTVVTVSYASNTLRKLSYLNVLLAPKHVATDSYYFDSTGTLVCHLDMATGTPYYEVYIPPYVIQYAKMGDPANHFIHGIEAQQMLSRAKFTVDYYLSKGNIFDYTTFDLSLETIGILAVKKSLPLREKASDTAPLLQKLSKGTELIYLDRSTFTDSVRGVGRWVWYKVRTTSGKTGWVWGFPTGVELLVDD